MNQYKIRQFNCLGCNKIVKLRRSKNQLKYCSLLCWRSNKHPQRKTGKIVKCEWCKKEIYKQKCHLKFKHHFCSSKCANEYQGKNKLIFICKICGKQFKLSVSLVKGKNPLYCNWECRLKDKEHIKKNAIQGNLIQQNKKGLNKLELSGRKILQNLGIKFNEQVLMFDKFLVDILIKDKPVIIQWDGEYWHNRPKRKQLDISQDAYLRKCGYTILRFTDKDIKNNIQKVYENIKRTI